MIRLILIFAVLFVHLQAAALDRVTLVNSKIQSSLSSILPRNDYIVVVNRLDTLDDGGATQAADGSVRLLPGLQLGVDSKGEPIKQDVAGSSYNGPVAIHVMIEQQVNAETFKTIEKLLPEIVGGLRDDDELKLSKGPLRQPPQPGANAAPQITIQNKTEESGQFQQNLKFLALLLLTGGLFFWFLSKINFNNKDKQPSSAQDRSPSPEAQEAKKMAEVQPADFAVLDPESVGLFLLKEVKDKKEAIWCKWVKYAPSVHQREVFRHLPAWVLNFLQEINNKKEFDEKEMERVSLHDLFNEIVLVEQSFKSAAQKKKAFLQWFPPESLRYVPRRQQNDFSQDSRKTLWAIRPDLGNFVRVENVDLHKMVADPAEKDIEKCYHELHSLTSVSIDNMGADGGDVVKRWIFMINQLSEFSPIDSQVQQAQAKLKPDEYERLLKSVAHLKSPLNFNASERKEWLRAIEPDDYYWWLHLYKDHVSWDLKNELRPMRWAMFQQAEASKIYQHWNEEDRKQASQRILSGFRKVIDPGSRSYSREVA